MGIPTGQKFDIFLQHCTKCGKFVTPDQPDRPDADKCSKCGNTGEGWKKEQFMRCTVFFPMVEVDSLYYDSDSSGEELKALDRENAAHYRMEYMYGDARLEAWFTKDKLVNKIDK